MKTYIVNFTKTYTITADELKEHMDDKNLSDEEEAIEEMARNILAFDIANNELKVRDFSYEMDIIPLNE